MSLLGPRSRTDPDATRRIKAWARERWGDDIGVTVSELRCTEPGCPPLETVVVIAPADGPTFQLKVHAPAAAVTRANRLDPGAASHEHH